MRKKHYLSIIIPVYNEEKNILLLHERLQQVLEKQAFSSEIIFVDDGSSDGTFDQLQALVNNDPKVRVLQLRRNFGQTAAMAAGIEASSGEVLIFMDGDLQNDPLDIPRLLAKLDEGYDVVCGWRKNRQDASVSRKLPSWLANRLIARVTSVYVHDYGCTLKAFKSDIFQHMRIYGEMHRFLPAYAALLGASIAEIEVTHHARQFGVSKYGISRTVRVVLDLLTVKYFSKYATRPMHAFGLPGLLLVFLSFITMGTSIVQTLGATRKKNIHGSALAMIVLLLGFGLQCLMMGLSAEMLMRIYYETQDKPVYTVKTTLPLPPSKAGKTEAA